MPKRDTTTTDHKERVALIVRHLEDHLDEPLDVDDISRRAAYAKHHFHRVFRGVTGESLANHVRRLRLERAARRLRRESISVIEAALQAGYDAPEAFTRAFVKCFGVAPSAYKGEPSLRVLALDAEVEAPSVEVRFEPEVGVYAFRHVGSYRTIGAAFETMMKLAGAAGLLTGPPRLYGLCPDDPDLTPEEFLRFDVCLASGPARAAPRELAFLTIPAGRYAVAVHRGSYATLSQTYVRLIGRWLPMTRHALADEPVIEVYLDDPATTPVDACRTEVRVRLE